MNELRGLLAHQLRRHLVCGALGCLVSFPVAAQSPLELPTRLDRFHVFSNGNIVSTKYASAFEAEGIRLAQNARIYGSSSGTGVALSKQLALNTRNGIVVAEARQVISSRAAAVAVRGLLGGPVIGTLLVGGAVLQWINSAGLEVADGQILAPAPVSPNAYDPTTGTGNAGNLPACPANPATWTTMGYCLSSGGPGTSPWSIWGYVETAKKDQLVANGWTWNSNNNWIHRVYRTFNTPAPGPGSKQPATPQEVEDRLASVPLTPAALKQLGEAGVTPTPSSSDTPSVTNPQPSPEKTTTKTNPDGSTETTVCRTVGTTQGNSVKLSEHCTVTARDPSGNITGTTTTATDQADPTPGQEERSLFCELFPNVLACAEFGDPEDAELPRAERSVSYQAQTLFGSGSCPADTTMLVRGQVITIGQWSSWCGYLVTYVRPIVLLLSAFAALMIVARGMPE